MGLVALLNQNVQNYSLNCNLVNSLLPLLNTISLLHKSDIEQALPELSM